jgi:hypothetical protein
LAIARRPWTAAPGIRRYRYWQHRESRYCRRVSTLQ